VKRQGGGFSKVKVGGAQARQKAEVSRTRVHSIRYDSHPGFLTIRFQAAALAVRADLIGPEPDLSGLHEFTNVSIGYV